MRRFSLPLLLVLVLAACGDATAPSAAPAFATMSTVEVRVLPSKPFHAAVTTLRDGVLEVHASAMAKKSAAVTLTVHQGAGLACMLDLTIQQACAFTAPAATYDVTVTSTSPADVIVTIIGETD